MEHDFAKLKAHILPLSRSKSFELARREWSLVAIEISHESDNCPCGHPIKEHCFVRNRLTGTTTYVGNVCIDRFGIETRNLFDGVRRIAHDRAANANEDVISHARKCGYLYDGEYDFLMQTRRKRKLSPKQAAWKEKINRRIGNKIVVQRRGGNLENQHLQRNAAPTDCAVAYARAGVIVVPRVIG
jgi:hypothetical protein